MKVLIHDYAGHPFPVELSRELVKRGYSVVHAFFAEDRGPKGDLAPNGTLGRQVRFCGLKLGRDYSKTSLYRRRFADVEYGECIARLIHSEKPNIVLSGNTPTESQEAVMKACMAVNSAFIYWMQDFYSVAAATILQKKFGWVAKPVSSYYHFLERRQLNRADAIVVITEDFIPLIAPWTTEAQKIFTIYNWGPTSYLTPHEKDNAWSRRRNLHSSFNFLYSGTLGLKHNPALLSTLASEMSGRAKVVVTSEGSGSIHLARRKEEAKLENLLLLPLQEFRELPRLLATADVAIALLEEDAGVYSVPSKVLSYLCSARALLVSAPANNLASRIVDRARAGLVVAPGDVTAFVRAADELSRDHQARHKMAQRGADFARENFTIGNVADKFEGVFRYATDRRSARTAPLRHELSD
jgi:colanic acid biosynthesis glycosyl transferase WcaI